MGDNKTYRRVVYVVKPGLDYPALLRNVDTLGVARLELLGAGRDGEVLNDIKFDLKGGKNTWHEKEQVTTHK